MKTSGAAPRNGRITIQYDGSHLRRQAATEKTIDFAGNTLPLRMTISWGLFSLHKVSAMLDNKRLELEGFDYQGRNVTAELPKRALRFLNSDIEELILPEIFLCQSARDWIEEVGERLILKIKEFRPYQPLRSKMATLFIAKDSESGKFCGILRLDG